MADVTLDAALMKYLYYGVLPDDVLECERVVSASKWMSVGSKGELFTVNQDGRLRQVPPISERQGILKEYHLSSGMCSGERLYQIIRQAYYWHGLRGDCNKYVSKCMPTKVERMKWTPPKYLYPIPKGVRPFSMWVVDTITGLHPPDQNGCTVLAVAICTFSKWVECGPVRST